MPDLFISYSRRDGAFVERLGAALRDLGRDPWIDVGGIEDAEHFPDALRRAIEASDSFVFVISPDAVASEYCTQEVEHAVELNKRIVPILLRPVDDDLLHPEVRDRNWIPFDEARLPFDASVQRLVTACDRDLDHARRHTRWLVKALEWDAEGRDRSRLLRGSELVSAENWLSGAGSDADPQPTALQREYVLASRRASVRRGRILLTTAVVGALVASVLVVVALVSRSQASTAQQVARSQAMASAAQVNLATNPQVSLALATRAVRLRPTQEALYALRAALDAAPLLRDLQQPRKVEAPCLEKEVPPAVAVRFLRGTDEVVHTRCDGLVTIRDARTLRVRRSGRVAAALVATTQMTPDGRTIVAVTPSSLVLVDARTLEVRATIRLPGMPGVVTVSPDGTQAVVGVAPSVQELATLRRVDLRTGRSAPLAPGVQVMDAAYLPDGRRVVASTVEGDLAIVDVAQGRVERRLPTGTQAGYFAAVAVAPDGGAVAVGVATTEGYGQVQLWRTDTWRRTGSMARSTSGISAAAFAPDSRSLAVGDANGGGGVWDVVTKQRIVTTADSDSVLGLVLDPSGRRLVTTDAAGSARIWRAGGPERERHRFDFSFGGQLDDLQLTQDGLLALGSSTSGRAAVIKTWAPGTTDAAVQTLDPDTMRTPYNGPAPDNNHATVTPDGRSILVPSGPPDRPRLSLVERATGEVVARYPSLRYSNSAVFAPDGRTVFVQQGGTVDDFGDAQGYLLKSGADRPLPLRGKDFDWTRACCSAFTSDGSDLVAVTGDGQLQAWSTRDGSPTFGARVDAAASLVRIADDSVLVTRPDGSISIRDLRTGRLEGSLIGHTSRVYDAEFSPDGRYVVTAGTDATARVWDRRTARELRRFELGSPGTYVAIDPTSTSFAVSDLLGTARVFDLCTACGDADALLELADRRGKLALNRLERTTVERVTNP